MKNYKKVIYLLIGIILCLVVYFSVQIYAKYLTSAKASSEMAIARWNILVNEISIKTDTDISNSIVPVFEKNENIAENIIAPTSKGYFDLEFDFKDADVSFEYEITTTVDENSSVKDLVTTGYSVDDGEIVEFNEYNESIKDTIKLEDNVEKRKIRIYISWNDDEETQQMNNADDTAAAVSDNPAILKVNISFKQIV